MTDRSLFVLCGRRYRCLLTFKKIYLLLKLFFLISFSIAAYSKEENRVNEKGESKNTGNSEEEKKQVVDKVVFYSKFDDIAEDLHDVYNNNNNSRNSVEQKLYYESSQINEGNDAFLTKHRQPSKYPAFGELQFGNNTRSVRREGGQEKATKESNRQIKQAANEEINGLLTKGSKYERYDRTSNENFFKSIDSLFYCLLVVEENSTLSKETYSQEENVVSFARSKDDQKMKTFFNDFMLPLREPESNIIDIYEADNPEDVGAKVLNANNQYSPVVCTKPRWALEVKIEAVYNTRPMDDIRLPIQLHAMPGYERPRVSANPWVAFNYVNNKNIRTVQHEQNEDNNIVENLPEFFPLKSLNPYVNIDDVERIYSMSGFLVCVSVGDTPKFVTHNLFSSSVWRKKKENVLLEKLHVEKKENSYLVLVGFSDAHNDTNKLNSVHTHKSLNPSKNGGNKDNGIRYVKFYTEQLSDVEKLRQTMKEQKSCSLSTETEEGKKHFHLQCPPVTIPELDGKQTQSKLSRFFPPGLIYALSYLSSSILAFFVSLYPTDEIFPSPTNSIRSPLLVQTGLYDHLRLLTKWVKDPKNVFGPYVSKNSFLYNVHEKNIFMFVYLLTVFIATAGLGTLAGKWIVNTRNKKRMKKCRKIWEEKAKRELSNFSEKPIIILLHRNKHIL